MTLQEEVLAFFESQDTKYLIKKVNIHICLEHVIQEGILLKVWIR